MNQYCTCGAKLPEDARFCHKCGKPQREEPEIEALAAELQSPAVLTEAPGEVGPPPLPGNLAAQVGFRNPAAVRAAILASAIATLAGLIPFPGLFQSLWQLVTVAAGGFGAVFFYQRRTGSHLSVRAGLQIGWMTGLFSFVVLMVMMTILLAFLSYVGEAGLRRLSTESGQPQIAEAFSKLLSQPEVLIFALVFAFFVMTFLGSAGGALGSQVLDKE